MLKGLPDEWKNMYRGLYYPDYNLKIVGNKAKGLISKRVFEENKTCRISLKMKISYPSIAHVRTRIRG